MAARVDRTSWDKLILAFEIGTGLLTAILVLTTPIKPLVVNYLTTYTKTSEFTLIKTYESDGLYVSQPTVFMSKERVVATEDVEDLCHTKRLMLRAQATTGKGYLRAGDVSESWVDCIASQFVADVVTVLGRENVVWEDLLKLNPPFASVFVDPELERRRILTAPQILETYVNPRWGGLQGTWVFRLPPEQPPASSPALYAAVDTLETLEGWFQLFNISILHMHVSQLPGFVKYIDLIEDHEGYAKFFIQPSPIGAGLDCWRQSTLYLRAACVARAYPMNMYETLLSNKFDAARTQIYTAGIGFNVFTYYELQLSMDLNSAGLGTGRCKASGSVPQIVAAYTAGGAFCRMFMETVLSRPENSGWGDNADRLSAEERHFFGYYFTRCLQVMTLYPEWRFGGPLLQYYKYAGITAAQMSKAEDLLASESSSFKPFPNEAHGRSFLTQMNGEVCDFARGKLGRTNCSMNVTYSKQSSYTKTIGAKPLLLVVAPSTPTTTQPVSSSSSPAAASGGQSNGGGERGEREVAGTRILASCNYNQKAMREESPELLRIALSRFSSTTILMTGTGVLFDASCTSQIDFAALKYDNNLFLGSLGCENLGALETIRFTFAEECSPLELSIEPVANLSALAQTVKPSVPGEMVYLMGTQTEYLLFRGPRLSCVLTKGILGTDGIHLDIFNKERLVDLRQFSARVRLSEGSIRLAITSTVVFAALLGLSFSISYATEMLARVREIRQQLLLYGSSRYFDFYAVRYVECSAFVLSQTLAVEKIILALGAVLNLFVIVMGDSSLKGPTVVFSRQYTPLLQFNMDMAYIIFNLVGLGQLWMRRGVQRLGIALWEVRTTRVLYVTMIGVAAHSAGMALQILYKEYTKTETLYFLLLSSLIVIAVCGNVDWGVTKVPVVDCSTLGSLGNFLRTEFQLKVVDIEEDLILSHLPVSGKSKKTTSSSGSAAAVAPVNEVPASGGTRRDGLGGGQQEMLRGVHYTIPLLVNRELNMLRSRPGGLFAVGAHRVYSLLTHRGGGSAASSAAAGEVGPIALAAQKSSEEGGESERANEVADGIAKGYLPNYVY